MLLLVVAMHGLIGLLLSRLFILTDGSLSDLQPDNFVTLATPAIFLKCWHTGLNTSSNTDKLSQILTLRLKGGSLM